jgi:hypothetical protein
MTKANHLMKVDDDIPTTMLAPCGMNCMVCYAHLRKKRPCGGCRGQENSQPNHCRKCSKRDCAVSQGINFCFECPSFPCEAIKRLDKSYRQRYQVSLIENGIRIKTVGTRQHLMEEKEKWTCPTCGGIVCIHDRICSECGWHTVLEKI